MTLEHFVAICLVSYCAFVVGLLLVVSGAPLAGRWFHDFDTRK